MKPQLLLVHGWAFDSSLWAPVLARLGDSGHDAVVVDRGYFGHPRGYDGLDPHRPILGVGQSLGCLELLVQPPTRLAGLVAIDGFARFAKGDDFPEGVGAPALTYMSRRLRKSGGGVIADFMSRALAGVMPPDGALDIDVLTEGLDRLAHWDGRSAASALPIWSLHADRDPIASLDLSNASFAAARLIEKRVRTDSADHLSPIMAPDDCAALIDSALRALPSAPPA